VRDFKSPFFGLTLQITAADYAQKRGEHNPASFRTICRAVDMVKSFDMLPTAPRVFRRSGFRSSSQAPGIFASVMFHAHERQCKTTPPKLRKQPLPRTFRQLNHSC
jgi:hypothetical protein